jgi:NADPH:quinone reductase-like Zn-dependent oxidoreductase
MMKAITCRRYGPPEVLALEEVETPTPKDDEVLIRVHATTVTSGDRRVRAGDAPAGFGLLMRLAIGISGPRRPILGIELAGVIEAAGKSVRRFEAGDAVFAIDGARMGGYAEYKCLPEDGAVALKPPSMSFTEAAAMSFGGTTALDFFRRGELRPGERVLVNGASGAVGTAAVQLAHHFGAEVTAVCSGANAELVRSLGANHVIDYTREDFTDHGESYDLIVDTAGTAPYSRVRRSLTRAGRLLLVLAGLPAMLPIPWVALTSRRRIFAGPATERAEDLCRLAELADTGAFRPVIDRHYPIAQIVEAHRYVDSGRKRGNVVVTLV